jgi:[glutamine synthetase] adenylyltransferase / [glutamine synthetase]-adenylyl-L-tyrosine phosphorylase
VIDPEELGRTLATAPDPELARVALSRVGERPEAREILARPDVLPVAVRLLGFSSAAADLLVAHPEEAEALANVGPRDADELRGELRADLDRRGDVDGLRLFRRRAMLRVAARDLMGALFEEVVGEITAIAEACLAAACAAAASDGGLAVIGMGKLGGAELNYASDVDLIFVHAGTGGDAQQHAERAVQRVIALLSEPSREGIALRVDAALRPGGRGGALSRSLPAMEEYYAKQAATWEKQALIKARPVAGDAGLGRAFIEAVTPFVYPDELHPDTIEEVRQTKVRLEEYVRASGKERVEVKRGRGGIRDVEFAVQLLQLVHGRRDERLREPNTLRALAVLADEGYVASADAEMLAGAYRFLRSLEHRLQMVRDIQTHDVPQDPHARDVVGRSLGFADAAAFLTEAERVTDLVRGLHERLFYRPLLEAFAGRGAPRPGLEREPTEELLAGLGFRQPGAAFELLAGIVDPATRLGRILANVFPVIAPALALAASPDSALMRLERVVVSIRERPELEDRLASDPGLVERLAHATAASSFATDLLAAEPRLLVGPSVDAGWIEATNSKLIGEVAGYAARHTPVQEIGARLSSIADEVVRAAVGDAAPRVPFAVIGLGKLGAQELNFASDLDVIFVYEGEGAEDFGEAARAAEEVIGSIRRAGWEPDADLRPEGRSGPIARSVAAFLEYWQRWAQLWEFQSLLRARFVAGDEQLGRRFELLASDFAYPPALSIDHVAEIRRMRVRIEKERVRPADAGRFAFKLGYGSLADVQFAVELGLMRHGGEHEEVRTRRTLDAIERLAAARLIEDSVALSLSEAYVFLTDVKNALEVDRRIHAEVVPPAPEDQVALARRLGYEEYPRQTFLEDYRRITRRARLAMERVFYGEDDSA